MWKNSWELYEGHISGLRLPQSIWQVLRDEGIMTLEQLRAKADRIHWLPGIGRATAQLIRHELARVASDENHSSPQRQDPER
jgi:hypothetical protein